MSRAFYVSAPEFISKFNAGRRYLGEMPPAKATFDCDLDGVSETVAKPVQPRCEERRSDCWLDWSDEAEEPAATEASARENAPAIVFGDIVRLLGMTFIVITVIDLSLKAFHLQ